MTDLAYLTDMASAYVRTFTARVTALPPGAVVLDRTYFYPMGGGQPGDRGSLTVGDSAPMEVVDVSKSGASVLHRLRPRGGGGKGLALGAEVEGRIDWARRHRHMRLHTAQHLVSAMVFERTGLRTRHANLSGIGATIDLEASLPDDAVDAVSQAVGDELRNVRPVSIRAIPRSEWDGHPTSRRSGLVPLAPHVDPVRVIEIEGADICPCGGTHVRSTGEIGPLRFAAPYRNTDGSVRIGFTLAEPDRPIPDG